MAAVTVISAGPADQTVPPFTPLTPDPSPSSLSLSFFILSLSFHPFLQSFLLFLRLSFVGLSCKCSCWPPILVVLRSLPKSNKTVPSSPSPSLSVCVHRGESAVGLPFPFSPPPPPKFHVSLYVEFYNGAQRGARTHDPEIKSLMLYRLS